MASAEDPARGAARNLYELFFSAQTHERLHGACDAVGLGPPVAKALLALQPGEARSMRELAEQWGCDASWVTTLIDGLEEHGFAERRVHPSDRRVRTIELTPLGVKARDAFRDRLHEPPPAFAALDADEVVALRDILGKVLDASG